MITNCKRINERPSELAYRILHLHAYFQKTVMRNGRQAENNAFDIFRTAADMMI